MKLFRDFLTLVTLLGISHRWVLEVHGNLIQGYDYATETFYSKEAENGCHEFSNKFKEKGVHDFTFCTMQYYVCQLSFYSDIGCKGDNLGHTGGRGYSWSKDPVSKAGSKMKSFRMTGCVLGDLPGPFKLDTWRVVDC
ncbi:hypothetical protein V1522DRAFT_395680 [Lipomyces starkeyi]